jgi:hypothetical protein
MAVIMIRTARCTFLRNSDGNRYFLYLNRNDDGSWNWNYNWLDNDRNRDNVSPLLATLFISHPASAGLSFLPIVPATRPASCRCRPSFPRLQCTYRFQETSIPTES